MRIAVIELRAYLFCHGSLRGISHCNQINATSAITKSNAACHLIAAKGVSADGNTGNLRVINTIFVREDLIFLASETKHVDPLLLKVTCAFKQDKAIFNVDIVKAAKMGDAVGD